MLNQITQLDTENLNKKFEIFDRLLKEKKQALGYLKTDPTLFAYYLFKNDKGERFKALPWQDKFLNSHSKRRLLCCARQVGKSTITGLLAIHKAYFNPGYTILIVSRTKDQAIELVYRMRRFLNTSRFFTTWKETITKKQENKKEIIMQSEKKGIESRIIVVPATDAALGYSANIVIGDEAARWEDGDRIFTEVLEPTVTWTQGDIYLLSTPAGMQGFFYQAYKLPSIWEIYQFDWTVNPYLTKEEIDAKKLLHTANTFAMNYLAKFVAAENAYFTPLEIQNSISTEAGLGWKFESPISVGVDFGKVNDYCIINIGTIINPTKPQNEHIIRVLDRRVKPLGTDYAVILEELKDINKLMHPTIMVLDVTSGEIPSDILSLEGVPIEPYKFTLQSKITLMNNLKVLMQQNRIQIPNEKELIQQLEVFQYTLSKLNQDRMKLHASEGYHDDEVDSLALMTYGLTKNLGFINSQFISSTNSIPKELDETVKKAIKANQSFIDYVNKNTNPHPIYY